MAHGLKWRSAAADFRRQRPSDVWVGNTNQQHRRLPHVPAKLLDCSPTTDRRRRGGLKAATALGFRAAAHKSSVAARFSGEGPRGAVAACKGVGVLLGVRATLGRRARGGLGGGAGGVWVGDGLR
jgi:hypothetical protein